MAIRRVFTTVETLAPRDPFRLTVQTVGIVAQERNTPSKRARLALKAHAFVCAICYPEDFSDERIRAINAHWALTLSADDAPLRAAFRNSDLIGKTPGIGITCAVGLPKFTSHAKVGRRAASRANPASSSQ
jgi:hypothetical protein